MKKSIFLLGIGVFLLGNNLFAQGSSCTSATLVTEGSTCSLQSYSLPGNSSTMTDPSCAMTTTHDDGWFKFVAAYNSTTITINTAYLTNINPPNNYPVAPVLAVYSSCSSSAEIICNDSNHAPISVTFPTTVGNTYYFRFLRETQFYPASVTGNHMYGQYCIYGANTTSTVNAAFSSSDSSLCDTAGCITFTDNSTGSPTNWIWAFPGATPDSAFTQNPGTICYNTPGTYNVTLIAFNSTDSDTTTISNMITVDNCTPIVANFRSNDTSLCDSGCIQFQDSSLGMPTNFIWSFPGGTPDSSTSQYPLVCYDSVGSYSVTLIAYDSTRSDTVTYQNYITVDSCSTDGIRKLSKYNILKSYYNASNKHVVITLQNVVKGDYHLAIVNSLGQYLINDNLSVNQSGIKKSYNLQQFSNGLYFIKLTNGKKQYNAKFIKY